MIKYLKLHATQIILLAVLGMGAALGIIDPATASIGSLVLATAPFPVQPELTAVVIGYRNKSLIADNVLPRTPVGSKLFRYLKQVLADGFTIPDTKVGRKSAPNQVEFSATQVESSVEDYGLDDPVPQDDIDTAPPGMDPIARAAMGVMDLVLLGREKRTADLVFDATQYAAANKVTLAGVSQWSDFVNSDPVAGILSYLDSVVMRPNIMVVGNATWTKLSTHPKICKAIFGNNTDAGIVGRRAFADLFELEDLFVGQGWVNTAKKGQAATLARVWGKHAALLYRDKMAGPQNGTTFGFTAQFGTQIAGAMPDKDIGLKGGQRVRAGEQVKEVLSAPDLAYFVENAVA